MTETPRTTPGFFRGLSMPFRGIAFVVRNPELARIWIIPVFLVTFLLIAGCGSTSHFARVLADRFSPDTAAAGDFGHQFTHGIAHGAWVIALTIAGWGLTVVLTLVLTPVLAAPFNELLGEEVERIELGREPLPFSFARVGRDLWRTIRLEAAKLGLYLLVVGPLALIGFVVSPLSPVASALGFLFTAAYFALDYVDGPLTRRSVGVRRRFELLLRHPAPMIGFGLGVWTLLFVPFVQLFFMPAAVVGGTRLCVELGLVDLVEGETTPASVETDAPVAAPPAEASGELDDDRAT